MEHGPVGIHINRCRQLASFDLDFTCSRLPIFWLEPSRTSFRQRVDPRPGYSIAISASGLDDQAFRAKPAGSSAICSASDQRGVRGLGGGAQECPQHPFLLSGCRRLCSVRPKTGLATLSAGGHAVRRRTDDQAHGHYPALCPVALGLLAARQNFWKSAIRRQRAPTQNLDTAAGESPSAPPIASKCADHPQGAANRARCSNFTSAPYLHTDRK